MYQIRTNVAGQNTHFDIPHLALELHEKCGFPTRQSAIHRMNLRAHIESSVLIAEFSPAES
eukprot:COSAG02_NODE_52124_length_309_cov_15.328571_1_plen_60_part_01